MGAIGKGVDDYLVSTGVSAFHKVYALAYPFVHWQIRERLLNRLTYAPHIQLKARDLSTLELASLPDSGIIAISSGKGTGKTKFISSLVEGVESVLVSNSQGCIGQKSLFSPGLKLAWRHR